MNNLPKVVAQ